MLKPFVLAAALAAGPVAQAQPICDAIKHAAKIGASDSHFAAFRREMPVLDGFTCRINVRGRMGAYACSTPVAPGARVATAKALIDTVRACVASWLITEQRPKEANAVFMTSRGPQSWVVINGADDPTRIYINVVVSGVSSRAPAPASDSGWTTSQVTSPYDSSTSYGSPPYDPGTEAPHFPKP